MIQRLSSKYPTEIVPITFDFSKDLKPGELITPGSAVVTVTTADGTDASPSLVKNLAPVIATPYVIQSMKDGVNHADYHFVCTVDTDQNNRYVLQCVVPVRNNA